MPLFGRKPKVYPGPTDLPVQDTLGDPDAIRLRTAMATADWRSVRAILAAATDPDDLSFLLLQAAEVEGTEEWLPDIVRADLDSTLPSLLYGIRLTAWAWEARSGYRAKYVNRDQFELFFERLRMAEDCLQGVVRVEPASAPAWAALVTLSRGLQMSKDESWRRFKHAVAAYPTHLRSHSQMLQNLCEKWSGSHTEMHDFAYAAMLGAPEGSALGHLVAIGHMEQWDNSKEGMAYMRSPATRMSLRTAADRSVRHPAYRPGRTTIVERSWFAAAFYLADEPAQAAEQFRAIGDIVPSLPWGYFGGGVEGQKFCQARNWAYARA